MCCEIQAYLMETTRLQLRPWNESDAEILYKYASDPDVGPRAGWPAHKSVDESRTVIQDIFTNDHTWAIVLKDTNEPIGCMGYFPFGESNIPIGEHDCEAGYWVAKPYWNQGICTEALQKMIDYCFNVKQFDTIWSDHFTGNPASGRVLEKCGFKDTGMFNQCSHLLGGDKDQVKIYRLRKQPIPCETCKFRTKYDQNPKSLLGRFWRWHIKFCPGWKAFFGSLTENEKDIYRSKYNL